MLRGAGFRHQAFAAERGGGDLLVVFIDGDGSPWLESGHRIASDPVLRVPLALELAAITPSSVLYLGRPCYLMPVRGAECNEKMWSAERYSAAVVASMTAAAATYIAEHDVGRVLLVGYSGGGTLAVLMAREVPNVVGIVTVAGNLDPDAWTRLHGYLPLEGSLNPAMEAPLSLSLKQWYLTGQRDTNVPSVATEKYMQRVPSERVWSYPRFDHVCCWVQAWPRIFVKIRAELNGSDSPSSTR
jgi:pimeloyl-ACP methyl ester carboxylesterase